MGLSDSPLCRRCGVKEETSAHIICECEALALLRHVHLGSSSLELEDIKNRNLVVIWNLSVVTDGLF
jgi:predicted amidophosphoribosyltransferase